MDLLDRARALAACPLFEPLAPALVIRLAALAHARELAVGEVCTSEREVWIVADGELDVGVATAKPVAATSAIGMIRVVSAAAPTVTATASEPAVVVGIAHDDVRDVLEEDPAAMAALAGAVARLLLGEAR